MSALPPRFAFAPEAVERAEGHLLVLRASGAGALDLAVAATRIDAPRARVWEMIRDVSHFPSRLPMVHKVDVDGDRVAMKLRFKIAFFSTTFGFELRHRDEDREWVELSYLSGEPRDIRLRFDLADGSAPDTTLLQVTIGFDARSLGWLVTVFLRNHPEIQLGVYPGAAFAVLDAVKRASEG